jgi:hypothetical protein
MLLINEANVERFISHDLNLIIFFFVLPVFKSLKVFLQVLS